MYLRLISFLPFVLISFRFTRPDHFFLENYLFRLPARLCPSYIAAIFPDLVGMEPRQSKLLHACFISCPAVMVYNFDRP